MLPPKAKGDFRKTLVLDLDETLVHSSLTPVENPDFVVNYPGDPDSSIYVQVRPGCGEFLHEMAKKYELVLFTASVPEYAEPLLQTIDPNGLIEHKLFRQHCVLSSQDGYDMYVKDLARLDRNLDELIIVDNSPYAYALQPDNAIPVTSWYDHPADRELLAITPVLEKLTYAPKVTEIIPTLKKENQLV